MGSANEIVDLTLLSGAGEFTLVHAQGMLGEIRVFDSTGRMVHRSSSTADRTVIGTQGWPTGIYSVVVATPNGALRSIKTLVDR